MTTEVPLDVEALLEDTPVRAAARRLRELDARSVRGLTRGLQALADGDFTVRVEPAVTSFEVEPSDADARALFDLVNTLQTRLDEMSLAYETLRQEFVSAFGDHSCLEDLLLALRSLNAHCLTDLDTGLQAMADGDYTHAARPVTHPLKAAPGDALGEVGETFNEMLARSRTALRSYDAVREDLRTLLGDQSCLDNLRNGLRSLQRHCLRDLEEALEALAEDTALTRDIAPVTKPLVAAEGAEIGELAGLFNRVLLRAQAAVLNLRMVRERRTLP